MNKIALTALVSAALAAAAPMSLAQTEGAGPQARQFAHRPHDGQRAFRSPVDRVEAQLAYLKTALKITGAQETQWNAFAEVRRRHAREMAERVEKFRSQRAEHQPGQRPTAIERLERRQAMMATASTRLNETLAAVKPLYAALSPEQKQVADELLAPRGRGGFRHRGGPRGRA